MSEQVKDGGPAFPWGDHGHIAGGMTLRDYFAAKALAAIIAHPQGHAGAWQKAAEDAYVAADAMLAAREKK